MVEVHDLPTPRTSRRTKLGMLLPVLLIAGWCGGKALVRQHVDGLIQGKVGADVVEFALRDQAGEAWTTARLRGRPALLHFFRSHCEACEREAAEYRQLERELPAGRATILHVVTDPVLEFPAEVTAATIAGKAFQRPVLLADAAFVDAFHSVAWSNVTPVTYVVDAAGRIRQALRGAQTASGLEAALAAVE